MTREKTYWLVVVDGDISLIPFRRKVTTIEQMLGAITNCLSRNVGNVKCDELQGARGSAYCRCLNRGIRGYRGLKMDEAQCVKEFLTKTQESASGAE